MNLIQVKYQNESILEDLKSLEMNDISQDNVTIRDVIKAFYKKSKHFRPEQAGPE